MLRSEEHVYCKQKTHDQSDDAVDLEDRHNYALRPTQRDWYFIAEQPAPAPHLAHPRGCAALRIVLIAMPRVSRSCEHFLDGFDLHLLYRPTHKSLEHLPAPT